MLLLLAFVFVIGIACVIGFTIVNAVVGSGNQLSIFEFRVKQNRVKPSF